MANELKSFLKIVCTLLPLMCIGLQSFSQIKINGTFVLKKPSTETQETPISSSNVSTEDPERSLYRDAEIAPKALNLDSIHAWIGYPEAAQKQGIEGKVIVEVLVSQEGRYVKHRISSSSNQLFTDAVNKRVKYLRFSPGKKDNAPVKAWTKVPFRFQLFK